MRINKNFEEFEVYELLPFPERTQSFEALVKIL